MSFLDDEDAVPKTGTYFSRAVAYLQREIANPVTLPVTPHSTHPDIASALRELRDRLRAFDPQTGDSHDLWCIRRKVKHLSELIAARHLREQGEDIPQFFPWQFDDFGLTDLTEHSEGANRYLVFHDMYL